jgi:hypothetical protein
MANLLRDTADVRAKLLHIWKLYDEKKIKEAAVRIHIGLARSVLETLKVEIAAAHLARLDVPALPLGRGPDTLTLLPRKPKHDA